MAPLQVTQAGQGLDLVGPPLLAFVNQGFRACEAATEPSARQRHAEASGWKLSEVSTKANKLSGRPDRPSEEAFRDSKFE
jgi:hypothetical protein